MSTLKELRSRIKSVKSTKKITSAMKMVAASKLKRAQDRVEAGRPYANHMALLLSRLSVNLGGIDDIPKLIKGTGSTQKHFIVMLSSDRGLCGGFNTQLIREMAVRVRQLESEGKNIQIICVGRKGGEAIKRLWPKYHNKTFQDIGKSGVTYKEAQLIANHILRLFDDAEMDVCELLFNRFLNSMSSEPAYHQVVPVNAKFHDQPENAQAERIYTYEPDPGTVLTNLLPRNLSEQIFTALLESAASEHGARMTAMDNATRNADDMVKDLNLTYNTTRQAYITRELVEIISGAEAV